MTYEEHLKKEMETIDVLRKTATKDEQLMWLLANSFPQKENGFTVKINTETMQPNIMTMIDNIYFYDAEYPGWDIYTDMIKDVYRPYSFSLEYKDTDNVIYSSSTIIVYTADNAPKDAVPAVMSLICGSESRVMDVFVDGILKNENDEIFNIYNPDNGPVVQIFIAEDEDDFISFTFDMENTNNHQIQKSTFVYNTTFREWNVNNYKPSNELPGANISKYLLKYCECENIPINWLFGTIMVYTQNFNITTFPMEKSIAKILGEITTEIYESHNTEEFRSLYYMNQYEDEVIEKFSSKKIS